MRIIRASEEAHLEAIHRISSQLSQEQNPEAGFLVSDYTRNDYREFLSASIESQARQDPARRLDVCVLVALDDEEQVVGFLLAYSRNHICGTKEGRRKFGIPDRDSDWAKISGQTAQSSEALIVRRFGRQINFFLVKQVAVIDAAKGYGRALYSTFLDMTLSYSMAIANENAHKASRAGIDPDTVDVFLAIMHRPRNLRSQAFHERLGFKPTISWSSSSDDGALLTRIIYHATSQEIIGAQALSGASSVAADPSGRMGDLASKGEADQARASYEVLIGSLEHARTL